MKKTRNVHLNYLRSKTLLTAVSSAALLWAPNAEALDHQIAYSQNNLPRQHCARGLFSKTNPLIFNADVLYGRTTTERSRDFLVSALYPSVATLQPEVIQQTFDHSNRLGLRAGLGVALGDNNANVSIQYTRLSTKGRWGVAYDPSRSPGSVIGDPVLIDFRNELSPFVPNNNSSYSIRATDHVMVRYGDLLVQTAHWNATEATRIQPFAGLRYLTLQQRQRMRIDTGTPDSLGYFVRHKGHLRGAFVGADLRFLISKSFHFFGSALGGLSRSHLNIKYRGNNDSNEYSVKKLADFGISAFMGVSFGLQFSYLMKNEALISWRIAYEGSSYFTDDFSDTQAPFLIMEFGSIGVTILF